MEYHVSRHQVQPYSANEGKGRGRIPTCFLVAGDATGDVNMGGNRVFDITQKLFRFWASCPAPVFRILDRVWACAPRIAQTYVRIESLRHSRPGCVKPSDLSRTNVVQRPEIFVVLLFYVHGKHLRSCRDGQLP